jgi:hypothetical protein
VELHGALVASMREWSGGGGDNYFFKKRQKKTIQTRQPGLMAGTQSTLVPSFDATVAAGSALQASGPRKFAVNSPDLVAPSEPCSVTHGFATTELARRCCGSLPGTRVASACAPSSTATLDRRCTWAMMRPAGNVFF